MGGTTKKCEKMSPEDFLEALRGGRSVFEYIDIGGDIVIENQKFKKGLLLERIRCNGLNFSHCTFGNNVSINHVSCFRNSSRRDGSFTIDTLEVNGRFEVFDIDQEGNTFSIENVEVNDEITIRMCRVASGNPELRNLKAKKGVSVRYLLPNWKFGGDGPHAHNHI